MAGPPLRDGAVAVDGGRIIAVGPAAEIVDRLASGPAAGPPGGTATGTVVHDWAGVLIPGLVNAHAHLEYGAHFADLAGSGLGFADWIRALMARRLAAADPADAGAAFWSAQASDCAAQALAGGTTCLADVVTIGPGVGAAARSGLAGVSYVELAGVDARGWAAGGSERLERLLALEPGAQRRLGISPHTLFTLAAQVVGLLLDRARAGGLRLHPHLAETAAEGEFVATGGGPFAALIKAALAEHELLGQGCGKTPTARLGQLGGLGADVHVAHGVHVDAADRALLREAHTAVALCVRSNAILAAGTPPVAAYREEGNPVAIGTDSLASTPDLDLLAECRALRAVALAQNSPLAGLDDWLLAAATRGGADAMGLADCGRLTPGARADLVLLDADPADGATGAVHSKAAVTVLAGRPLPVPATTTPGATGATTPTGATGATGATPATTYPRP